MQLVTNYYQKTLPKIRKFNDWFYDGRIMFAYYLGGVYNEFIDNVYGVDKLGEIMLVCKTGKPILKVLKEVLGVTAEEYDKKFYEFVGTLVKPLRYAPVWGMNNIEEMKIQLASDPDNVTLLARLADGFTAVGIEVDAEIALDKAMKLDSEHAEVQFTRARMAARKGEWETAYPFYEKAFEKGIDNFQLRYQLGKHYLQDGQADDNKELTAKGVDYLQTAVEYFPAFVQQGSPVDLLLNYYAQSGEKEKEMACYELITDTKEKDLAKLQILAEYYKEQGNTEKAIHYYWQIVLVTPLVEDAHAPLAELLWEAGDYERAALEYNAARFFDKDNLDFAVRLAACYLHLGKRGKAYQTTKEVLEKDANHKEANELLEQLVD